MKCIWKWNCIAARNECQRRIARVAKNGLAAGAGGVTVEAAMKMLPSKAKISGLTLIEVLAVMFVIVVLVAMLLPSLARVKSGRLDQCLENQHQIAGACVVFQDDNGGKFPWQLSATNGGAMELVGDGHPSSQFRMIQDYVRNYNVWICPTEQSRQAATNNATFGDLNTSDFVNVDAAPTNAAGILTGERHLVANGWPVKPGLFFYKNTSDMGWTRELHGKSGSEPYGFMSFADGHAEFVYNKRLNAVFQQQGVVFSHLAVP
jgi:type II secretory pathway pseudopilin PulG